MVEFRDVAEGDSVYFDFICGIYSFLALINQGALSRSCTKCVLVSNQSSCHSPTQRQAALICSPINVSILQYGVVRHIDDELLIVVPESDSATDPKKQV